MKKLILIYILCFSTLALTAQQNTYSWRVGAYGGYNFYQGDLNNDLNLFDVSHPLNNFPNTDWQGLLSYGASLEYNTKGFGIKLLGTRGIFRAEDRAVNYWNGAFLPHNNFQRSLNVENQFYDAAILATFYSDNGRFLSKEAFVSPYLSIGFGGMYFETFSDLQNANGQTYYYWSDGKIYDKPEMSLPPDVKEITRDFTYETDLKNLNPEGVFSNLVWNIPLAIGLKFRVTNRFNINLEVMGRYTSTDYLDGVSTRGNPDNNDFYGMTSLSVHYNFGRKTEDFLPPTFYSLGGENATNTTEIAIETEQTTSSKNTNENGVIEEKIGNQEVGNVRDLEFGQQEEKIDSTKNSTIEAITIIQPTVELPKTTIDTINEVVIIPQPIIDTTKRVIIKKEVVETENVELTKIEVDTPKIERLEIVETPIFLLSDKNFSVEKQTYLDVQKTRLEAATLNEQANTLLVNYDATKVDSFMILNQKIDIVNRKLETYQQYMTNLAIQGNANYTKPENQAIEKQVSSLEAETAALRQKYRVLVLGEDDPKAVETELQKIEKANEVNKAKIAALEAEVTRLEQQKSKVETNLISQPTSTPPVAFPKNQPETDVKVIPIPIIANTPSKTVTLDTLNTTNLPDSVAQIITAYDAEIKNLSAEVNRLNTEVIPQKDQTIQFLNTKVVELQGELKGIKETNKYYADLFQKQITALQQQIAKLSQLQPTTIVQEPKVIEKIVQVPAPTKATNLQDLVKDFGVTNIYFANGSTAIKSEFNNNLNRVVSIMLQHPEIIVVLNGYTDKSGNAAANLRLSKKRAETVKNYLIRQGISMSRIDIGYFGDNSATAVNDAFSRRVEVKMIVN